MGRLIRTDGSYSAFRYNSSIRSRYFSSTTRRFTFSVGVNSPLAIVSSFSNSATFFTFSNWARSEVRPRYLPLKQIDDARVFAKFRAVTRFDSLELCIRIQTLPVRNDQRRRKPAPVANQDNLINKRRTFDQLFDRLRRDVFSSRRL